MLDIDTFYLTAENLITCAPVALMYCNNRVCVSVSVCPLCVR